MQCLMHDAIADAFRHLSSSDMNKPLEQLRAVLMQLPSKATPTEMKKEAGAPKDKAWKEKEWRAEEKGVVDEGKKGACNDFDRHDISSLCGSDPVND